MSLTKQMTTRLLAGATALVLFLGLVLGTGFGVSASALGDETETLASQQEPVQEDETTPQGDEPAAPQEPAGPEDDEPSDTGAPADEGDQPAEPQEPAQGEEDETEPQEEPDETSLAAGAGLMLGDELSDMLFGPYSLDIADMPGGSEQNPVTTSDELQDIWAAILDSKAPGTIYIRAGELQMQENLYMSNNSQVTEYTNANVSFVGVGGDAVLLSPPRQSAFATDAHFRTNLSVSGAQVLPLTLSLQFEGVVLRGQDGGGGIYVTSTRLSVTGARLERCGLGVSSSYSGDITDPDIYTRVTNTRIENGGRAVFAYGNLLIENCHFEGNTAPNNNAGVFVGMQPGYHDANPQVVVRNTRFINNTSGDVDGGGLAIYNNLNGYTADNVSLLVEGCTFTGNQGIYGAGIFATRLASVTVRGTSFTGNRTNGEFYGEGVGGAVWVRGQNTAATLRIESSSFASNWALEEGGGVYATGLGSVSISGGSFTDNEAVEAGGGLMLEDIGSVRLDTVAFSENEAEYGGAVYVEDCGAIAVSGGSYIQNIAAEEGGAIFAKADCDMLVEGVTFTENEAGYGGAILAQVDELEVRGGSLTENEAYDGGAIFSVDGTLVLNGANFTGNTADRYGGAIYADGAKVTATGGALSGNVAGDSGGALFSWYYSQVALGGTKVENNTALAGSGGALYVVPHNGALQVRLTGETRLEGNKAPAGNGGAVAVPYANLGDVTAGAEVVFAGNISSQTYYIDAGDQNTHDTNILGTAFSNGFAYGYNNNDIAYTAGRMMPDYTVAYHPGAGEGTVYFDELNGPALIDYEFLDYDNALLNFSREHYTFAGWSRDAAATVADPAYAPGERMDIGENFTLYAVWEPKEYTVTFTIPGGATTTSQVRYGALVPEPAQPSRTGHTFRGWFLNANTRWVFVDDAQQGLTAMTMPGENITLTAQLEINSYRLTFRYNNGSANLVRQVEYGATYQRPDEPTRAGYTFAGWYDEAGNLWSAPSGTMPAGNVTYDARWNEVEQPSSNPDPDPEPSSAPEPSSEPSSSSSSEGGGTAPDPGPAPSSSSSSSRVMSTTTSRAASSAPSSTAPAPASSAPAPAASGPDAGGTESGAPTPAAESQPDADETAGQDGPTFNLFGTEMPLGGLSATNGWSAANLLLALIALVNAVLTIIRLVRRRTARVHDDDLLEGRRISAAALLGIAALVTGILPIILLPIVENVGLGVMMFSRWTPLYVAFTVAHFGLTIVNSVLARRRV